MTDRTCRLLRRHELLDAVESWIADGWGLEGEPSDEQAAAALLMEAKTQDRCVRRGESSPEYPRTLRRVAYEILDVVKLPPQRRAHA